MVFLILRDAECLWENLTETQPPNWEEFEELFSKQTAKKSPTEPKKAAQPKKAKEVSCNKSNNLKFHLCYHY